LQALEKGLPIVNLMENWDFLQIQCAMYINSDLPGLATMYQMPGKPMRWVWECVAGGWGLGACAGGRPGNGQLVSAAQECWALGARDAGVLNSKHSPAAPALPSCAAGALCSG
jgi:hypothetical protein